MIMTKIRLVDLLNTYYIDGKPQEIKDRILLYYTDLGLDGDSLSVIDAMLPLFDDIDELEQFLYRKAHEDIDNTREWETRKE